MVIRLMTQNDVGSVLRYIKKYFGDFPSYYNKDYVCKKDTLYLLAINDYSSLVGLVSLNKCDEYFEHKDCFEIGELIVSEGYRTTGLSSLLVHEVLNYVPFDKEVFVSAWGTISPTDGIMRTHAKNALERNGFTLLKRDLDYYANNGDCAKCINKDIERCRCYNDVYMFTSVTERNLEFF